VGVVTADSGFYDPTSPTGWPREWTPGLVAELDAERLARFLAQSVYRHLKAGHAADPGSDFGADGWWEYGLDGTVDLLGVAGDLLAAWEVPPRPPVLPG
jgi:hypothetical protein